MGYIPGFKYDIFISYAHVDNLEGWVKQFQEDLKIKVAQRFGRQGLIHIWWDESLTGDELFDEVIKNRINQSAIFLALNSSGYSQSDYCKQEIRWFYTKATREPYGVHVGERMRFFNVCLYHISHREWPAELGRTSGFEFFDKDQDTPLESSDPRYRHQMNELGKAIYLNLSTFKVYTAPEEIEEQADLVTLAHRKQKLFLATATLLRIRNRVKRELEQKGIEVHEEIPPPDTAEEHEQAVKEALADTLLSVHLLDHRQGAEIDGDEATTYPLKQLELGQRHANSNLIWVPRTTELESIANDSQKARLLELRDQPRDLDYRFVHGLESEITNVIIDFLEELQTKHQADTTNQLPSAVLLDTHVRDSSLTIAVSQYLLDRHILPYINPQEDDPRRNLEFLKDRLKQVSAFMIFYGQVNVQWVRARLVEVTKIIIEEGYPIKSYAVYLAPPDSGKADLSLGPGLMELDNRKGFNPDTIRPFLRSLGGDQW